jgi:sporulation protein YlmC with PRC-barrel domain
MTSKHTLATITLAAALFTAGLATGPANAQVAGATTTVGVAVVETTQVAMGWSVKKTLMGKTVYNAAGQKVGKVEDLIISPDKSLSYLIVGAGGFAGIGRHDVAIPVAQVKDEAGKLVLAGATPDSIKAMPAFDYANDTARRDRFIAAADADIAKGKARLAELEKKAGAAATDAKSQLDAQAGALRADVAAADAKLTELKAATAARWKEFEAGVSTATARLRKSVATNLAMAR